MCKNYLQHKIHTAGHNVPRRPKQNVHAFKVYHDTQNPRHSVASCSETASIRARRLRRTLEIWWCRKMVSALLLQLLYGRAKPCFSFGCETFVTSM